MKHRISARDITADQVDASLITAGPVFFGAVPDIRVASGVEAMTSAFVASPYMTTAGYVTPTRIIKPPECQYCGGLQSEQGNPHKCACCGGAME